MDNKLEFILQAQDQFSSELNNLTAKLPSLGVLAAGAAAGIAATGAAMWTMTKGAADAYDAVNDLSLRLGITTEFISKMNYAAQMSGMTSQEMGVSLKMLSVKLGEASAGAGPAADAFNSLGVRIKDSNGHIKTAEEIMPELADGFAGLGSAAERAALAQDIFSRGGVAMLPMLSGGSAGFEDISREAEKFGLIISTKAAKNAAEMNDAMDRMKGSATGLRNSFAEDLFPVFSQGFNAAANIVANNREAITQWSEAAVYGFSKAAEMTALFGGVVADVFRAANAVFEGVKFTIASIGEAIAKTLAWAAERVAWFLEKINFGGMWDVEIAGLKRFEGAFSMMGDSVGQVAQDSAAEVQAYWDGGMGKATSAVQGFVDEFKKGMAETANMPAGAPEGGGREGVIGDSKVLEDRKNAYAAAYANLKQMHDEHFLNEEGRLYEWYEKEKEAFAGHQEELALLDEVYQAQKDEIKNARNERLNAEWEENVLSQEEKLNLWYQRQLELYAGNFEAQAKIKAIYDKKGAEIQKKQDAEAAKDRTELYKNLETIGTAFGKRGILIAKAIAIPEAIVNTYTGAANALKLGWPQGAIAAAAIIAQGFGYVASIRSQAADISIAHGGLDYVQSEQTMLVDRGERILSPRQNQDLTEFLAQGGGSGSSIHIDSLTIRVLENATNLDALRSMDQNDITELVEYKIIPAIAELGRRGIKA